MTASQLLASATTAAKAVASIIEHTPAGAKAAAALTAGRAVLSLVADLKDTASASPEHVAEFEASREALERAVNAHADRTAASLG